MNLPTSGKTFIDKSIQDTRLQPGKSVIPLREQARGVVEKLKTLLVDDNAGEQSTFNGEMSDG